MASFSFWEKESFYASSDIMIIGAGLMGLWTAWELKKKHPTLSITLLEANPIPMGASTRNAGFACYGSPTELWDDLTFMGEDQMLEIAEMRYQGICKISKEFDLDKIQYQACGGFECINQSYEGWNELDERIQILNQLLKKIHPNITAFNRADEQIQNKGLVGFDAMYLNALEGSLHSGKYVQGFMQKLQNLGIRLLTGVKVTNWKKEDTGFQVFSNLSSPLQCKQLICCSNAFSNQIINEVNVQPARGQVLVTNEIPNLPMQGTFHFDKGFYYWRNIKNRILIGGARNLNFSEETTQSFEGSFLIKKALIQFLRDHLHPSIQFEISDYWSGIMGFTDNKLPIIKKMKDDVYLAIACNGMGVALSPIFAEKLVDLISKDL